MNGSARARTSNRRFLKALFFKLYCLPTAAASSFFVGEEEKEVFFLPFYPAVAVSVVAVLNSTRLSI